MLSNAVDNSFNVSIVPGAPSIKLSIAVFTNAVDAIFVVLSPADCDATDVVPEAVKSAQVTLLSFNKTPSIVTPDALVLSLIVSTYKLFELISFALISLSFNNTPSIVTPIALVFSLIVSADNVPSIDISPPSPVNKIVALFPLSFTSKSLKLPCLDAEIKLVLPTA